MSRRWPYTLLGWAIVVAVAVAGLMAYNAIQREIGRRDAAIEARDKAIDSLEAQIKRLDAAYTRDTAAFTRQRGQYEALRQNLLRQLARRPALPSAAPDTATPTIAVVPSLPDSATVHDFIRSADSTIAACSVVVLTCERRVATEKARGDSLRVQLDAERSRGKFLGLRISRTTAFLLGAGVVLLVSR